MEKNKKGVRNLELVIRAFALLLPVIFSSCSISKQISKQANTILLKDTAISSGHIGISIYEPATNKYWYNYNATKYFIPASNTKLFTLYAGMKYLGDSLVGLRYQMKGDSTVIEPSGDPTFLLPEFKNQPVLKFLKNQKKNLFIRNFCIQRFFRQWVGME
ncbi:D-alanyl-D-alanine carboxypeptidase [Ferruginibacter sp.]